MNGYGAALATGLLAVSADVIVFLDADLVGLCASHIDVLVAPLAERRADCVLGAGTVADRFPSLTGERAYFREDLLPLLREMCLPVSG